jgi:hypothetical protein
MMRELEVESQSAPVNSPKRGSTLLRQEVPGEGSAIRPEPILGATFELAGNASSMPSGNLMTFDKLTNRSMPASHGGCLHPLCTL